MFVQNQKGQNVMSKEEAVDVNSLLLEKSQIMLKCIKKSKLRSSFLAFFELAYKQQRIRWNAVYMQQQQLEQQQLQQLRRLVYSHAPILRPTMICAYFQLCPIEGANIHFYRFFQSPTSHTSSSVTNYIDLTFLLISKQKPIYHCFLDQSIWE